MSARRQPRGTAAATRRAGVYIKPTQSKTSILQAMKASGVKPQAGKSIAGFLGSIAPMVGGILGGPIGAQVGAFAGQALGALAAPGAVPGVGRRTYQVMLKQGAVVTLEGRTLGYTRKKAKKMFGRRRRQRLTKADMFKAMMASGNPDIQRQAVALV